MQFIKNKKIWYSLSGVLVVASIFSLFYYGLNLGIDFTGGSLLEIKGEIKELPDNIDFNIQKTEQGSILRFKPVTEAEHQIILNKIGAEELRFESIGPAIGQELKTKAFWAIGIVIVLIILYIAWAFRKIKAPFKYGLIAIIALVHDVLITLGIFSFLQFEISTPFIAALLTILGYSVNDTIVVFDRIRENLSREQKQNFPAIINLSINQTLKRSLFTSLTTLFVLLAIFFFGGVTIKAFILALIIGIISGTYSSIFLASPLLISLRKK